MSYAAIIYQGMVTDLKAVAVEDGEQAAQEAANQAADKANSQLQGESEGYTAIVVPIAE